MRGYIFFSILKVVDVLYQTPQQEKCYQIPKDDHSNSFHNVSQTTCAGAIILPSSLMQFPNMSSPFSIFFLTYSLFVYRYWPYGSDGCQIHGFQGFLTALASIGSSAAIAWDRYHHYCTSKGYNLTSSLTQILL